MEARADLAAKRDSPDAAIQVFDKAFQPLWPKALLEAYFKLLDENSELRDFEGRARAQRDKNPGDLDAASRLFAYHQHTGNQGAARRVLFEYRLAKEANPGELDSGRTEDTRSPLRTPARCQRTGAGILRALQFSRRLWRRSRPRLRE